MGSYHTRLAPRAIRAHIVHFFTYPTRPSCGIHYYLFKQCVINVRAGNFLLETFEHRTETDLQTLIQDIIGNVGADADSD